MLIQFNNTICNIGGKQQANTVFVNQSVKLSMVAPIKIKF